LVKSSTFLVNASICLSRSFIFVLESSGFIYILYH
jgi:hypothetical protein